MAERRLTDGGLRRRLFLAGAPAALTSGKQYYLYVTADVRAGEPLTPANVRSVRPGLGLPPADLDRVLGRVAARDLRRGEPLAWDMVG